LVIGDVTLVNACNFDAHLGWLPSTWQVDNHDLVTSLDQVLDAACANATGATGDDADSCGFHDDFPER
jgi:hypothetical protein